MGWGWGGVLGRSQTQPRSLSETTSASTPPTNKSARAAAHHFAVDRGAVVAGAQVVLHVTFRKGFQIFLGGVRVLGGWGSRGLGGEGFGVSGGWGGDGGWGRWAGLGDEGMVGMGVAGAGLPGYHGFRGLKV